LFFATILIVCVFNGQPPRRLKSSHALAPIGREKAPYDRLPPHTLEQGIDQIQFLLGRVSVQTTERYIGCTQRLRKSVDDHIGLEPELPPHPRP